MRRVLHQVAPEPTITLMKSRRIALPKAGLRRLGRDYSRDLRPAKWIWGHCKAATLNRSCPLGLEAGMTSLNAASRLPKKRTSTFTDSSFHDIGSAQNEDVGRGKLFPNSTTLRYAFKTPTLRDVARRGPYMHDGSMPTLLAVIDLYDRGGIDRPSRAIEIYPLGLSDVEKADLIAFLETLTGRSDVRPSTVLPR